MTQDDHDHCDQYDHCENLTYYLPNLTRWSYLMSKDTRDHCDHQDHFGKFGDFSTTTLELILVLASSFFSFLITFDAFFLLCFVNFRSSFSILLASNLASFAIFFFSFSIIIIQAYS